MNFNFCLRKTVLLWVVVWLPTPPPSSVRSALHCGCAGGGGSDGYSHHVSTYDTEMMDTTEGCAGDQSDKKSGWVLNQKLQQIQRQDQRVCFMSPQ